MAHLGSPWCCSPSFQILGSIVVFGAWLSAGIVAVVASIAVALISGDWAQSLMGALGGTILGYLAAVAGMFTFDYLDIRWLRTGRPAHAWAASLLLLGPAVALLVPVLVSIDA